MLLAGFAWDLSTILAGEGFPVVAVAVAVVAVVVLVLVLVKAPDGFDRGHFRWGKLQTFYPYSIGLRVPRMVQRRGFDASMPPEDAVG